MRTDSEAMSTPDRGELRSLSDVRPSKSLEADDAGVWR